ncbi:hypothetical protein Scep_002265 [Stephania cephalantha]|uniref:FAS1 domain-containing protein n=1 Tax=Stephania cephalantha TaxID=152367 RepID=A0AAP0LDI2_9MAGN
MASLLFFESKTLALTLLLLLHLHVFSLNGTFFAHAIPESELQEMLSALRSRGYNLFANAITASDLRFDVLAGQQFTFFAPTDSALFALDMKATASSYLSSLSLHIVPRRRLTAADLRSFATARSSSSARPPILRTLLPNRSVRLSVSMKRSPASYVIFVDGVAVAVPGLFYGLHVAVHGLDGILSRKSSVLDLSAPSPSDEDLSSGGGAVGANDDGGFSSPSNDVNLISPVVQDLRAAAAAPVVQPPMMKSPEFASSGGGFPVPEIQPTLVRYPYVMLPVDGSPRPEVHPPMTTSPDVMSPSNGFPASVVQPPVMSSPGMMSPAELYGPIRSPVESPVLPVSPGYGFPVPGFYDPRPPVEAPAVQVSPVDAPVVAPPPGSIEGDDLVKRLEAIVGEMPKARLGFLEF